MSEINAAILADLFSGDDNRAARAVTRLTPDHAPILIEHFAHPDADRRWWAVCGLAHLAQHNHVEAVMYLITAAADPHPDVRVIALHALGQTRAPEAVVPLLFALSDPSAFLARIASDALMAIGPAAVPGLLRALANDAQAAVRVNAARALAHLADPSSIPALFRALNDESALVQYWAEEGLERMGAGQVYFQP